MAKDLTKSKEIEKMKKQLEEDTLPGLETPDSTKASFFQMRGFPMMEGTDAHRSALRQTINVEDIVGAAEAANDPMMEEQIAASRRLHGQLQSAMIGSKKDDKDDEDDEDDDNENEIV